MNTTAYLISSTIIFFCLGLLWNKGSWLQFLIKLSLFLMGLQGAYIVFTRHLLG